MGGALDDVFLLMALFSYATIGVKVKFGERIFRYSLREIRVVP